MHAPEAAAKNPVDAPAATAANTPKAGANTAATPRTAAVTALPTPDAKNWAAKAWLAGFRADTRVIIVSASDNDDEAVWIKIMYWFWTAPIRCGKAVPWSGTPVKVS